MAKRRSQKRAKQKSTHLYVYASCAIAILGILWFLLQSQPSGSHDSLSQDSESQHSELQAFRQHYTDFADQCLSNTNNLMGIHECIKKLDENIINLDVSNKPEQDQIEWRRVQTAAQLTKARLYGHVNLEAKMIEIYQNVWDNDHSQFSVLGRLIESRKSASDEELRILIDALDSRVSPFNLPLNRKATYLTIATVFRKRQNFDNEMHYLHLAREEARLQEGLELINESPPSEVYSMHQLQWAEPSTVETKPTDVAPIWIRSYPRSGTTLLASRLCRHSKVECVGESNIMMYAVSDLMEDPSLYGPISYETLNDYFQHEHKSHFKAEPAEGYTHVVDKTVPVLHDIPTALRISKLSKVIFLHKHPLDCILGNYRVILNEHAYGGHTLEDVARKHAAWTQHWSYAIGATRDIPDRVLLVEYNTLVSDFENEMVKIFDWLGLDQDGQNQLFTLETGEAAPTHTASHRQVHKPVSNSEVGRWKNYAKFLAPIVNKFDFDQFFKIVSINQAENQKEREWWEQYLAEHKDELPNGGARPPPEKQIKWMFDQVKYDHLLTKYKVSIDL